MHVPEQPDHQASSVPDQSEDAVRSRAEASSHDIAAQFDQATRQPAADMSAAAALEAAELRDLVTKQGAPIQRVTENKDALRRADRAAHARDVQGLTSQGLDAYEELSEAARRLAARTETLGRRTAN